MGLETFVRILFGLLIMSVAVPADAAQFSDGVGASWILGTAGGACTLEQRVGDYGVARFSGVVGQPLRLEVLGHRDLFAPGPVDLHRVAPAWHANYPSTEPVARVPHRSGGAVRATDPIATEVLMSLYEGFDTHVARAGWYAPHSEVAVEISSVSFRPLYEKFIDCFRGVSADSWADVERTRVIFPTDLAVLDDKSRAVLERIAAYVAADPHITEIFIDGHTDSSGTRSKNIPLSKRRAESVAAFFGSRGIRPQLLVIRYHGSAYPVQSNDTPEGRTHNRRTTVRLARDWAADGLAQRP